MFHSCLILCRLFFSVRFKPICLDCSSTVPGEFKIEEEQKERKLFERDWNIKTASQTLPLLLQPNETKSVKLSYTPLSAASSSALLYIR